MAAGGACSQIPSLGVRRHRSPLRWPSSRTMKTKYFILVSVLAVTFVAAFQLLGTKSADFSTAQVDEIWKEVWKSADPKTEEPKIEKLSEKRVIERMAGQWTVMFGVIPDKLTVLLRTNRMVEVYGQKDGKAWKKSGEWRAMSNKLVLFLKEDDIPSFIFTTRQRDYMFDPWAKTMMSELK